MVGYQELEGGKGCLQRGSVGDVLQSNALPLSYTPSVGNVSKDDESVLHPGCGGDSAH